MTQTETNLAIKLMDKIDYPGKIAGLTCTRCGKTKAYSEFMPDSGNSRPYKECKPCRESSIVPPGFEPCSPRVKSFKDFITLSHGYLRMSASLFRNLGKPERCDIFYNPETKIICIHPKKDGGLSISEKKFNHKICCASMIKRFSIESFYQHPVTIKNGLVFVDAKS